MPIPPTNDTLARLADLQHDYQPREIAVLGDIVHRAMALPVLADEVRELFEALSTHSQLTFIAGNHDRNLQIVLKEWMLPIELIQSRSVGDYILMHGDAASSKRNAGSCTVMGHEHPAISIGDGVTTSQKCPCFLVSESVIVLPAFSRWAAGTDFRAYPFMSEAARASTFTQAVAICGEKLLPVQL